MPREPWEGVSRTAALVLAALATPTALASLGGSGLPWDTPRQTTHVEHRSPPLPSTVSPGHGCTAVRFNNLLLEENAR